MPFKSAQQRRWMYATHPKMAKRWSAHVNEMPYFDSKVDFGGKTISTLDLRIERYPIEKAKRDELLKKAHSSGIVGVLKDQIFLFKPDGTIEEIDETEASKHDSLPNFWANYAISEGKIVVPSMVEVYRIGSTKNG